MSTDILESLAPRPKLYRMAVMFGYFFGMTAIVGWSLPEAGPAGHRVESTMRLTGGGPADTTGKHPGPTHATRSARNRVNCDGCGVVESVRSVVTRDEVMAACAIGGAGDTPLPGILVGAGEPNDLPTLADTVAGAISDVAVDQHRAQRARLTTRHRIVVRFRDGSRHVFDEDTPRTLREGDRIKVIAGSNGMDG